MSENEDDEFDPEKFEKELNTKIDNYFSSNNNELLSYENLDDFLREVELYDLWNSEEEKDTLWQSLMKYGQNDKVDAEGSKKGIHELLNKQEEDNNEDNQDNQDSNKKIERKKSTEDNLLTRISRLSIRNEGGGTVNKLVLNKYIQRALDEYDCLDNHTLFQFKKIFSLLNISENNKNIIPIERIEQILNQHKSLKLEKNEVIKYIHFLSCDDKPIEEITSININNTLYNEIELLIHDKLNDEDIDIYEEEEDGEKDKEDPLDILDEIQQKIESAQDNSLMLKEMKNNWVTINQNYSDTVTKILQDSNENQNENISALQELGVGAKEKIDKFDEFLSTLTKDQQKTIKKIHTLKRSIEAINNKMIQLEEDSKTLHENYYNNKELEVNDEMDKLYYEIETLNDEMNSKKEEISQLINERAEKDNQINELYVKLEESQKSENDLKKQVSTLKLAAAKSKEEYDKLMESVINKIEKKENEELMEKNRIKEMIEKQGEQNDDNNQNKIFNALNNIDNLNIPLTEKLIKKKKILSQLSNDQLMEYTLKLERLNINLKSEKNNKDKKIKELEEKLNHSNKNLSNNKKEIGSLNIEIKKLQKIISNLKSEVKTKEAFRPSIAMNNQMRISRMSKLNTAGINAMKFKEFQAENKIKNSNDYFKNIGFNVGGKKQIKTTKLKDTNINEKLGKKINTNIEPQNIMNSMYGNEEKINEEQNEEEAEQNNQKNINEINENNKETNNKKDFEISNNNENIIEGQKEPLTGLTQNGIEFNIQSGVDMVAEEGGEIVVDNINDINLGGGNKDLFEIKEEENLNEDDEPKEKNPSQNKPVSSFFESKPETDFEISGEKKEENNINFNGERETIQVNTNNANQMAFGGLEDMIFAELENNEEEEEENNLGRTSEHNSEKKNELQMTKYGLDIENKKRKKSGHENNIKSSGDIIQTMSSKDKLEEVANNIEKNKLEINNNNQINIEKQEQKDINLSPNSNNQINNENSKPEKGNNLEITNDKLIIENKPNKEKDNLEISKSNNIKVENDKQNISPNNNNTIQISSQNNTTVKSNDKNQIVLQEVNNINLESRRKRTASFIKKEKEEIEKNNYDYYSLFHEDFVLNKLKELKDDANERNIYSDQIYLLSGKKLEKRLILLTPSYIYIIEPKDAKFEQIIEKNVIEKIGISNQNLNILIIIRNKAENIILLTLRRMDLLNFFKQYYHHSQKTIRFTYEDSFKIKIKGKETLVSVKDKIFNTLSNFDGAIKIGYLQKMNPLFFKMFSERLAVLTSIGLIIFNDPTKPPERLYPIIGSKITKALGTKYKRPNCFEILTPNGETKVFSAYKERELNSWMEEFDRVKKDFSNRMKKLDTVNKIEFIDNKNNLFDVKEEDDDDDEKEEDIIPVNK